MRKPRGKVHYDTFERNNGVFGNIAICYCKEKIVYDKLKLTLNWKKVTREKCLKKSLKSQPVECKKCVYYHNAGHPKGSPYQKYNKWCIKCGKPCKEAIGHCKLKGLFIQRENVG
jgi:hypothetical protein